MAQTLIFATSNPNKTQEIRQLLGEQYLIQSLKDIGFTDEIPETKDTIQGNALQKVMYLVEVLQKEGFAEDTGLEIEALGGEPGVYSARYAGPQKKSDDNMALVLEKLDGIKNRAALIRTVIALYREDQTHFFEGIVKGKILQAPQGNAGFGYDPIFMPDGFSRSFAEMDADEKNKISHRGIATRKLVAFLRANP
ncbi:MAG: RdgB/HAM1 family non-canonical purine NTP pyrophosphatase [Saprospiraceae bacterium]|nr:RdgB/HAM1 family non-canonical purine NTP pyrophosphatase [Saprospiraceae bacterium]